MSLFKKIQSKILPTQPDHLSEPSSSSILPLPSTNIPPSIKPVTDNNDVTHKITTVQEEVIETEASVLAEDYLVSIKQYQEQDNLRAALQVCTQGLNNVSASDNPQLYENLQKEKKKLLAKLRQQSQGSFVITLPYDNLYTIFGYLELNDLVRCMAVCQQWFKFVMEWPDFWDQMYEAMPNLKKSNLIQLLRGETQELILRDPVEPELLYHVFSFLTSWEGAKSMQKLDFANISMPVTNLEKLGEAVKRMSSSLKQISFKSCYHPSVDIVERYILSACASGLTRAICSRDFKYYSDRPGWFWSYDLQHDPQTIPKMSLNSANYIYSALTYLKVDLVDTNPPLPCNIDFRQNIPISTMLSKCPHLVHLFMATYVIGRGIFDGISQAIESCPQLLNLIITPRGDMMKTAISDIKEMELSNTIITPTTTRSLSPEIIHISSNHTNRNNSKPNKSIKDIFTPTSTQSSSITRTTTGLRRFVLSEYEMDGEPQQLKRLAEIFQMHFTFLEFLYLDFDGSIVNATIMDKLATHGFPKLREFCLCTTSGTSKWTRNDKPMTPILIKLFSACPALESIKLDEEDPRYRLFRALEITGSVIHTIAEMCPQLWYLYVSDNPSSYLEDDPPRRHQMLSFNNGQQDEDIFYTCTAFLCFTNMSSDSIDQEDTKSDKWGKMFEKKYNTPKKKKILKSLTIDKMNAQTALTLVKNLESLTHLHIMQWRRIRDRRAENLYGNRMIIPPDDTQMDPVKKILEARNGSLVLGAYH